MIKEVAVVIPMYKKELSELEKISLTQGMKIFRNYDVFLMMPYSLKFYGNIGGIKEIRFEDKWFASSQTYSGLLMKKEFYKAFEKYKYILIYQLDAFIFEDKLMHFCSLGYDYIGAPWLSGLHYFLDSRHVIWHVGNGGLSLRNVSKCEELLEKKHSSCQMYINEDIFFSMGNSDDFKVAPVKTALEFAFETEVKRCFEANGEKIPFGCHAWEKWDLAFWKPYIECCGYKIEEKYLQEGNGDILYQNLYERQKENAFFWEQIFTIERLRKFIEERKRKIYVWGAGKRGSFFGKLLSEAEIRIEGYLDNNAELLGKYIEKYEILPIKMLEKVVSDSYVIIAIDINRNQIAEQLEKLGCKYNRDYIFYEDIFQMMKDMGAAQGNILKIE